MVKRQLGLTLIELLITISLIGFFVVAVMPFTQAWTANAEISKSEKFLLEALAKARNEALRNTNGVVGASTMAAKVSFDNSTKEILVKNSANVITWKSVVPALVSINFSPDCSNTVQFNNNAQIISVCQSYSISANGGTNATGQL
jgi:type IV fimbrial biogenesis protein FimT